MQLQTLHACAAVLHLAQFVATVTMYSTIEAIYSFELPVHVSYVSMINSTAAIEMQHLFDFRVAIIPPIFFILTGVSHIVSATETNFATLRKRRWQEYSVTATMMIIGIALLSGIWDLGTLLLIALLNREMIYLGDAMDKEYPVAAGSAAGSYVRQGHVSWTPFYRGCVYGIFIWLVIFLSYGVAAHHADIPDFVTAIVLVYFLCFMSFAGAAVYGYTYPNSVETTEKIYVYLSFIAKTLLAWILFGSIRQDE